MLWVLKRTLSMRRFFWAPKTYVKIDGKDNIYNFTLKNFVYLNLCLDTGLLWPANGILECFMALKKINKIQVYGWQSCYV